MALAQEDIDYIKHHVVDWLTEWGFSRVGSGFDPELRERVVRVEEELRHQRELMQQGFALMEKRFEQVDKRFEQVDKRFEQVEKRFEQVDKRFEEMIGRFQQVDTRFDQLTRRMDRFMVWSFATTLAVGGLVVGILKAG
ncbi:MAG: hypothetical protein U5S82_08670 [Gammaproteobacteria bacterium]|nr:hypothetical protein [Gammaproteobacteria bacterium]